MTQADQHRLWTCIAGLRLAVAAHCLPSLYPDQELVVIYIFIGFVELPKNNQRRQVLDTGARGDYELNKFLTELIWLGTAAENLILDLVLLLGKCFPLRRFS
ncbi:hypothetical protein EV127DRAFT_434052 [Xylaria flabelliformis]|nr:hypothetical protein EV127DRAFT_434052 [Xylaria flabelliformis]